MGSDPQQQHSGRFVFQCGDRQDSKPVVEVGGIRSAVQTYSIFSDAPRSQGRRQTAQSVFYSTLRPAAYEFKVFRFLCGVRCGVCMGKCSHDVIGSRMKQVRNEAPQDIGQMDGKTKAVQGDKTGGFSPIFPDHCLELQGVADAP